MTHFITGLAVGFILGVTAAGYGQGLRKIAVADAARPFDCAIAAQWIETIELARLNHACPAGGGR